MKSPFKFLDSYTKEDRNIFFGRKREIEELYHRVFESKIMLVYGVSGTGKSSLIHCGLANKFSETDWLPLMIRRGGNMIESLAAAIKAVSITKQVNECSTPAQFRKAVKSLYLDHYKPVYFIFDQFEELFIFGSKEEKKEVIQVIKALTDSDIQCRFIFVMREEYMAGITEFEKYIPTIFSNRVRIEKMAHINAIEAIKGPCEFANISIEDGFAESLLERLSPESADVELTYLQVFLDKIYRLAQDGYSDRSGKFSFTLDLLHRMGNVSDLLGSFLEEQIKELDEPDTGLAVIKSFVSIKGTKRQLTLQEVIETTRSLGIGIEENNASELLQKFVNLRILRDKDLNNKYELRHDSLATKIYEKITLVEKELMEIYQFLENANAVYTRRKVLLSPNDLIYIAPYEERLFVNKETEKLIDISKKELNKIKKRIKSIAVAGFFSILTFSLGAILMTYRLPFSGIVRLIGLLVYAIWFLPLFGYYVVKTKENRTINLLFLVFTLLFIANIYLYNTSVKERLRFELFLPIAQNEEKLSSTSKRIDFNNDEIFSVITDASLKKPLAFEKQLNKARLVVERSNEVVNYIQSLKVELITITEGPGSLAITENGINVSAIKRLDDKSIPSMVLIGSKSNGKAFELKALMIEYRIFLSKIVEEDQLISNNLNFALKTDNQPIMDNQTMKIIGEVPWENYTFNGQTLGFVLITLSGMQNEIKNCESEVLTYIQKEVNKELSPKK